MSFYKSKVNTLNTVYRSDSVLHLKKMEIVHSKVEETSKSFHTTYRGEVETLKAPPWGRAEAGQNVSLQVRIRHSDRNQAFIILDSKRA